MADFKFVVMMLKEFPGVLWFFCSPVVAAFVCRLAGFHLFRFLFSHPLYLVGATAAQMALTHTIAQKARLPSSLKPNLRGKHAIVTGASNGIGVREAATLAKFGAQVTLAVRSVAAGEAVARSIVQEFGLTDPNQLVVLPLDLSSQASVREFARLWKAKGFKTLDILLNNAGIMDIPFTKSVDGLELHIATNHVGHFLLTELLMDELKASGAARVVNTSSGLHMRAGETPLPLDYLAAPPNAEGYTPEMGYAWSKQANVLHAKLLNEKLKPFGGSAYSVHPGVINTNLIAGARGQMAAMISRWTFGWLFLKAPQAGADTILFCALSPDAQPGGYHADCHPEPALTRMAMDDAEARRLWAWSEKVTSRSK